MGHLNSAWTSRGLDRKVRVNSCLFRLLYYFKFGGYISTHWVRFFMPAKFTVALVLDEETNEIWDALPDGEKSKRLREALLVAEIVHQKDQRAKSQSRLLKSLRITNKALMISNDELRYFSCSKCRCTCTTSFHIDKDGKRVLGEVLE